MYHWVVFCCLIIIWGIIIFVCVCFFFHNHLRLALARKNEWNDRIIGIPIRDIVIPASFLWTGVRQWREVGGASDATKWSRNWNRCKLNNANTNGKRVTLFSANRIIWLGAPIRVKSFSSQTTPSPFWRKFCRVDVYDEVGDTRARASALYLNMVSKQDSEVGGGNPDSL